MSEKPGKRLPDRVSFEVDRFTDLRFSGHDHIRQELEARCTELAALGWSEQELQRFSRSIDWILLK